jgi:hypothetical protein
MLLFIACKDQDSSISEKTTPAQTSEFFWKADSLGDICFENSVMLLPIDFESENEFSQNRYISFHTGHNKNHIYEGTVSEIVKASATDSTGEIGYSRYVLSGSCGSIVFKAEAFDVMKRPVGTADSIVGQISLDFFKGKTVMIDFKEKSLTLYHDLTRSGVFNFQPYDIYLNHKIILPVIINNKRQRFLLNPQSALFVVFNPGEAPGPVSVGNKTWDVPDTRMVSDANPDFDGIMGYAFLKDKIVMVCPEKQEICILDTITE